MRALLTAVAAVTVLTAFSETLTVNVASGTQDGYTADQLAAISGGTVTEIKKTGAGTLVSKGISSYAGKITVAGGTLSLKDNTGLGTTAGATYVESGAAITIASSYCGADAEEFHIAGTGIDNGGALSGSGNIEFTKMVLDDDAKVILGAGTVFMKATGGFFDPQGHTLTITATTAGAGDYHFAVGEVRSVGTVIADNFKFFDVQSDMPKVDGKKGKFILRGTTSLLGGSASVSKNIEWDLEWEDGGSGSTYVVSSPFNWAGDWYIGSGRNASFDAVTVNLYGNLRGSGTLTKYNDANGCIFLHGANNTEFTGSICVRGGKLVFMKKTGLVDDLVTRVQFTNSDVAMVAVGAKTGSNPDGFETADIQSFFDAFHTRTSGIVGVIGVYVPDGETFTGAVTFDKAKEVGVDLYSRNCDRFRFGSCGGGTCVFTGPFVGTPSLNIYAYGDLRFSNPSTDSSRVNSISKVFVKGGNVRFENAGTVDLNNGTFYAEGVAGTTAPHVTFANTKVINSTICPPQSGNASNGKIDFSSGSTLTGRFEISSDGAPCAGTIAVCGGDATESGSTGYIGNIGQGCLLVEAGRMYLENYNYFGNRQTGVGQIYVSDGTFGTAQNIALGEGGTGVVYQTGGTIDMQSGEFQLGNGHSTFVNEGLAHSQMSLAGGIVQMKSSVRLGSGTKTTSFLNLIGGTLETKGVVGAAAKEKSYRDVAFDGGTLKAISTTTSLLSGELTATVYAGGAVIDTAGYDVSLGHALIAATGKGISSITMPEASYTGFSAPPVITILGDGRGATAVPVYDHATGTVTGIRVTSPGYGYSRATATMSRGNSNYYSTSIALTVELADNTAPVKLTKRGAGTLTLSSGDLPANAAVTVDEGSLVGAAFAEYVADVDKVAEGVHGSIPSWPSGARLSVVNTITPDPDSRYVLLEFSETTPAEVPECSLPAGWKGWQVQLKGNKLVLQRATGFFVIVY